MKRKQSVDIGSPKSPTISIGKLGLKSDSNLIQDFRRATIKPQISNIQVLMDKMKQRSLSI